MLIVYFCCTVCVVGANDVFDGLFISATLFVRFLFCFGFYFVLFFSFYLD